MSTKFLATALTALTLAAGTTALTSEAQAGNKGVLIGAGIAAGLVGAAIIANSTPTYVVDPGYRRCHRERQYNAYGQYVGSVRVCRDYY